MPYPHEHIFAMASNGRVGMVVLFLAVASLAKEMEPPNPLETRRECSSEDGHIWLYGDVDQVEVASPEECCTLCESTPDCAKWSFGYAGKLLNKCLLRASNAFSEKRAGIISGWNSAAQRAIELERRAAEAHQQEPIIPSTSLYAEWISSVDGSNDVSNDDVLDYFSNFGSIVGTNKPENDQTPDKNLVRMDFADRQSIDKILQHPKHFVVRVDNGRRIEVNVYENVGSNRK